MSNSEIVIIAIFVSFILTLMLYILIFRNDPPTVYYHYNLLEEDAAMLNIFTNCKVYGKITLPSGLVIPEPPKRCYWHLHQGYVSLIKDKDYAR